MYSEESNITILNLLLRFYSKALVFPYQELGLELQHLFRQIETACRTIEDEQLAGRVLEILNNYQGEELSVLQAEYSRVFSHPEGEPALVPIDFADYGDRRRAEALLEEMYDSDLDIGYDEQPGSIINLLDYFSLLSETDPPDSLQDFSRIINPFSHTLYSGTTVTFYREVARGLSEICLVLS